MARLRIDNSIGTLGASLSASGTTITFASAPSWATLAKGNIIALVLDPPGASPNGSYEVVYVTAYTSGATTATIKRGQENTTGVSHANGATWMVSPTSQSESTFGDIPLVYVSDFTDAASMASSGAPLINTTGNATIDTTNQQIKNTDGSENRIGLNTSYLGYSSAWRGGVIQVKYVPSGTAPDFSLTMNDWNDWVQFQGSAITFKNFTGGTNVTGNSVSWNFTSGSTYWLRFEQGLNRWLAEIWTIDPSTATSSNTPAASNFASGNFNTKHGWGRPGIRMNTTNDLVKEIKFWRLPLPYGATV